MRILVMAISLAILPLGSVPVRADDAETIAAVNAAAEALDKAFEQQDAKAIAALMTPDHVAVTPYYDGPQSTAEQIASLPDLAYAQENLDEPKVTLLGADAAIRTFSAELKGTYKGRPIPSPAFVTALMVRKDGKWLEKFYQVTRIAGERMSRRGACRELAGTYLTRNSAEGGFTSRSLLSFDRGGLVFISDSGEGGETDYAPFSAGQGAWSCATSDGDAAKAHAVLLDFTFPKAGEAGAQIGRLDLDLSYDSATKGIAGTGTLTLVPLDGDPLKGGTGGGRQFKIEGTRVEAP